MNLLKVSSSLDDIIANQSIAKLVDQCEEDWGDPAHNAATVIRTGIDALDNLIYGFSSELIGVMGESGSRKSTFVSNIILFNALSKFVEHRVPQVILTAESGMTPSRYRDILIAMRATQYLRAMQEKGTLSEDTAPYLSPDFFRFYALNAEQQKAVKLAKRDLANSPIWILGSGDLGGVDTITNYENIFSAINANIGYCCIYVDHIHSIYVPGVQGDYETQLAIVPVLAQAVKVYRIPLVAVSQVSVGSVRMKATEARGGTRLREETSLLFTARYKRFPRHSIELFIDKSRKSQDKITVEVEIEPNSGIKLSSGVIKKKNTEQEEVPDMFTHNGGMF